MSQKRSSALRFRAGIALKGPERFRAGAELEPDTVLTRVPEHHDLVVRCATFWLTTIAEVSFPSLLVIALSGTSTSTLFWQHTTPTHHGAFRRQ